MRRLSLWLRTHPVVGDSVIAALLFVLDFVSLAQEHWQTVPTWALYTVGVLLAGPLAVRRKWPLPACWALVPAGVLQLLTHGGMEQVLRAGHTVPTLDGMLFRMLDIAFAIGLYTMVVYTRRRQALLYLAALVLGTAAWEIWTLGGAHQRWVFTIAVALVLGSCWALGEMVGARRAYHYEVEQRVRLLETERDQQARIAVAEERARIARELHDVVAHAVSVIVVQADGAAYAVRSKPDLAERAVRTISTTGRDALAELRRLLDVLRDEQSGQQADAASARTPQPGTGGLAELAQRVTSFGVGVRLHTAGDLSDLPTGVGLGVYRIVQEALTNTFKHAGADASADVEITRDGDAVLVRVSDNGTGAAPALVGSGGGNGLIGMRERAGMYGGTLEAGPGPDGGWVVRAELPLPSEQ